MENDKVIGRIEIIIEKSPVRPELWLVRARVAATYEVFACATVVSLDEATRMVWASVLSVTGESHIGSLERHLR